MKPPEIRRNRVPPSRGEWVELKPPERPLLPRYDKRWSVPEYMWTAWRRSPVTTQYGPEDVAAIRYLGEYFEQLTEQSRFAAMDRLGLTPKGKRDLRWRTPAEVKTIAEQPPVKRLRVVDRADAAS